MSQLYSTAALFARLSVALFNVARRSAVGIPSTECGPTLRRRYFFD
ncbi:MAG: hypothetical protein R3C09_11465 [Pirellulaceae bacterium]